MPAKITQPALIPVVSKKVLYIDNLKVILTVLVVLHHVCVTYGAPGGWYYFQRTTQVGALIPMTLFVSVNQSFFMGFFFFLSALFVGPSYERKGAVNFLKDRLVRLGLPLIFYSFIFSPFLSYLVYYFGHGHHINYIQYLGGFHPWIDFGVLWFVAALLLFTFIYALCRALFKKIEIKPLKAPSAGTILLFAAFIGFVSFLVRTVFFVGWVLEPVGFQLGHFSQYIALFIVGLAASKNNWLNTLSFQTGKRLALFAGLLLLFFPVFYIIKVKLNMPTGWFSGGLHWQALLYAVWEQVIGFSIITALLCYGKKYWDASSAFMGKLSRNTFAVYIFHPLAVISLPLLVMNWAVDPAIKFLLVAPLAVICSFLLASLIIWIPGVKKII